MVKPPNHFGKRTVSELAKHISIRTRGSAILLFPISIFLPLIFCPTHNCLKEKLLYNCVHFDLNYISISFYLLVKLSLYETISMNSNNLQLLSRFLFFLLTIP